jgi:7,8-dihydroneopterin aldolase/epimerase/oxygenase
MVSVELQNILVHAFHGIYGGEERIGSNYEIGLKVSYEEGKSEFSDINDTINYADLYTIVKEQMQVPTPLLEKVADGIIRRIKAQYPAIKEVVLSIYKLEPPIENFQGRVGVTLQKRFND